MIPSIDYSKIDIRYPKDEIQARSEYAIFRAKLNLNVNFLYKSDIGFNGYEQELPTKSQKLINAQLIWTRNKQQEQ
jgi:hypothetical protein